VLGTFLKVGALNYGGASVGIIQAEAQEQRGWISKAQFLDRIGNFIFRLPELTVV